MNFGWRSRNYSEINAIVIILLLSQFMEIVRLNWFLVVEIDQFLGVFQLYRYYVRTVFRNASTNKLVICIICTNIFATLFREIKELR